MFLSTYTKLLANKTKTASLLLLSLAIWSLEVICTFLIASAWNCHQCYIPLLLALTVANLGKCLPLTPGGIGIYEGIFAMTLTSFAIPYEQAILIAITDHLVKKSFVLGLGIPSALMEIYNPSIAKRQSEAAFHDA